MRLLQRGMVAIGLAPSSLWTNLCHPRRAYAESRVAFATSPGQDGEELLDSVRFHKLGVVPREFPPRSQGKIAR